MSAPPRSDLPRWVAVPLALSAGALGFVTWGAVVALADGVTFLGVLRLAIEAIATVVLVAITIRVARGPRPARP